MDVEEASEFLTMKGLAEPARRALASAGLSKVTDLQSISKADLAKLHGMGPKAIRVLIEALEAQGLSFSGE